MSVYICSDCRTDRRVTSLSHNPAFFKELRICACAQLLIKLKKHNVMYQFTFAVLCSRAHMAEVARATCCLLLGQQSRAELKIVRKFSVDIDTSPFLFWKDQWKWGEGWHDLWTRLGLIDCMWLTFWINHPTKFTSNQYRLISAMSLMVHRSRDFSIPADSVVVHHN